MRFAQLLLINTGALSLPYVEYIKPMTDAVTVTVANACSTVTVSADYRYLGVSYSTVTRVLVRGRWCVASSVVDLDSFT
jgi:hypothetical protein